ncbi:MAG: glycosyltransferase family 9 protein [Anaerolineae bacterium]|nr:glycosyltransferase family 9 protein [Gemmatimonadaceae bacterium]
MQPERILIVSLDNLGDLVFASALLPPIKERFPNALVTVWCKAYTADIGPLLPGVHKVVASDPFWDRAPGRGKGALGTFTRAALGLRRERFDVAVLAAAPWRTAAAVAALGIPVRIGLLRARNRRFLTHPLAPEDRNRPVLEEIGRLLQPLGIETQALRYRLDGARLEQRRKALSQRLGNGPLIVLHAFASKRNRCVNPSAWIAVAETLEARHGRPVWLGSSAELTELRELAGARSGWLYSDIAFSGSLLDAAAAVSMARVFVGHDSGPMHIASALGVPTVGIFAPGEPNRTFPQGVGPFRVLSRDSPHGITREAILAEVDTILAAL